MNFQNIPRENKVVKRAVIPKLDALLYFDYRQIEYRIFAYFLAAEFGDRRWADRFVAGEDAHAATAMEVLGYEPPLTDEERQHGKTLNFSMLFLGGAPTIMRQTGWPKAKAVAVQKKLQSVMGVSRLQDAVEERLRDRGYVMTVAGRHLRPKPDETRREAARRLLNGIVQGSAAEIMREATRRVHTELLDYESHIVNIVHDEISVDAVEDEIDSVVENMPTWMDYPKVSETVPIEIDTEISHKSWADKEPYATYTAAA